MVIGLHPRFHHAYVDIELSNVIVAESKACTCQAHFGIDENKNGDTARQQIPSRNSIDQVSMAHNVATILHSDN